jgi:hypothetical protein
MLIEGMEGTEKRLQPTDCRHEPGGKDVVNVATTNHITLALADVENKSEEGEIDCSHAVGYTPRVLMQGRRKSRRRTPTRIPLYSY